MNSETLIEEGIVLDAKKGEAFIEVSPKEACEECSAKIFCNPSDKANKKIIQVKDPFGVLPGDFVKFSLEGKELFKASVLLYGIPLFLLISGIFVGLIIFDNIDYSEFYSFLFSLFLIVIYFFSIKSNSKLGKNNPEIIFVKRANITR